MNCAVAGHIDGLCSCCIECALKRSPYWVRGFSFCLKIAHKEQIPMANYHPVSTSWKPGKSANPNGRPKGIPNAASLEIKTFCRSVLEDPEYREKVRQRVIDGEAPHVETLMYHYGYGKPVERIAHATSEG